jgi:hypothetical protein
MTRISPDKAGRWRCGAGQPASSAAGRKAGTPKRFEIVCCDCGDDPDLDYREVTPQLRRIRGPYPIAAGVAA